MVEVVMVLAKGWCKHIAGQCVRDDDCPLRSKRLRVYAVVSKSKWNRHKYYSANSFDKSLRIVIIILNLSHAIKSLLCKRIGCAGSDGSLISSELTSSVTLELNCHPQRPWMNRLVQWLVGSCYYNIRQMHNIRESLKCKRIWLMHKSYPALTTNLVYTNLPDILIRWLQMLVMLLHEPYLVVLIFVI